MPIFDAGLATMAGENVTKLPPLAWASAFETGSANVDEGHRELLADINEMSELVADGHDWQRIVAKSAELCDKCFEHFCDEQAALDSTKFDERATHKREHRRVERELKRILARIRSATHPSHADIQDVLLLRSTLVDHFFRFDLSFKARLAERAGGAR